MILPLATRRDKVTQTRWGRADFRHRFGREPEGMWLPETAVNEDVLAMLVDEGIRFTILAPDQAAEPIDSGVSYRWEHPDVAGQGLDLVFYDGALSRAVAFEGMTSQALVDRATAAGDRAGLAAGATDGET